MAADAKTVTQIRSIVLADDHPIFRLGLRSVLEKLGGVKVVGEASNGKEALELVRKLRPRFVTMDIGMPGMDGCEAIQQIATESQQTLPVALSMYTEVMRVRSVLKAGAAGYVVKDSAASEIGDALASADKGGIYVSPRISAAVLSEHLAEVRKASKECKADVLAPRERQVLQFIANGFSTKQIGVKMHLSPKTVETYRSRIMRKLSIDTIAGLTRYAIKEGIVPLNS